MRFRWKLFLFIALIVIVPWGIFQATKPYKPEKIILSPEEQHKRKSAQMLDLFQALMWYATSEPLTLELPDGSYEYVPDLLHTVVMKTRSGPFYYFDEYGKKRHDILYDYDGNLLTMEQLASWDPIFSLSVLVELDIVDKSSINHGSELRPVLQNICASQGISSMVLLLYQKSYCGHYDMLPGLERVMNWANQNAGVPPIAPPAGQQDFEFYNTEAYDRIYDNSFLDPKLHPLSTFSIDVDTASYANVRRFLTQYTLPPEDAVRIEEMINYFSYDYPKPVGNVPFSAGIEVADCPWQNGHRLVRIGLKGKEIQTEQRPLSNLVFLLDVSGSMSDHNKLPLLKSAFKILLEELTENDRMAIVVYAGLSGQVLPSTPCHRKQTILDALEKLEAGGSTNAGSGIQLAYQVAVANYVPGGVNRVILATDGDFNVGITNRGDLIRLIEERAASGVYLSVLGFGMGNYKDSTLENLADKGNGNYAYIDNLREARKVFVEQMGGTLITIAKDVKIQVEFNPAQVSTYRLIGYENRLLQDEDFNDDSKDAGEIGAGHTVTAFYEITPASTDLSLPKVDPLKYQTPRDLTSEAQGGELLTVKLRYKDPEGEKSELLKFPVYDQKNLPQVSEDFAFAASVAAFGMVLRNSEHKGTANLDLVLELARKGKGIDKYGYRAEFIELVKKAKSLQADK